MSLTGQFTIDRDQLTGKIFIEIEARKTSLELVTTLETLEKDVEELGLSEWMNESITKAVLNGSSAGYFRSKK